MSNKRIKKKRLLEIRLAECLTRVHVLEHKIVKQAKEIADLRSIIEQNAQATNSRFNYLEKKVADKVSKKSWFSR